MNEISHLAFSKVSYDLNYTWNYCQSCYYRKSINIVEQTGEFSSSRMLFNVSNVVYYTHLPSGTRCTWRGLHVSQPVLTQKVTIIIHHLLEQHTDTEWETYTHTHTLPPIQAPHSMPQRQLPWELAWGSELMSMSPSAVGISKGKITNPATTHMY